MEPSATIEDDNEHRRSQWCDIPSDVLFQVLSYMEDSKADIPRLRLRGVCSSWRSSLSLPPTPSSQLINVPPLEKGQLPPLLLESRFYLLSPLLPSSSGGHGRWVARMGEIGPNKWHLYNPINVHDYFFVDPPIIGSIDLLSCRVLELSRVFSLVVRDDVRNDRVETISQKVVGGEWNYHYGLTFAVMAQLGCENGRSLVLWRSGDQDWSEIKGTNYKVQSTFQFNVIDIAFLNGKFYAFDISYWRIGVIDPSSELLGIKQFTDAPGSRLESIGVEFVVVNIEGCLYVLSYLRLLATNEQLYLIMEVMDIDQASIMTMIIFVLKEDNHHPQWERVHNLGDEIFFIGNDASFSLSSASDNLPEWKPGSICWFARGLQSCFEKYRYKKMVSKGIECPCCIGYADYSKYFSFFDGEDEERGVVYFEDLPKQVYTGLFFPPPAWVEWRCPSLDNVEVSLDRLCD